MTGPRFSTPSCSLEASLGIAGHAYLPMPPRIAGDSRSQTLEYDALTNDELSLTPPAARPSMDSPNLGGSSCPRGRASSSSRQRHADEKSNSGDRDARRKE